MNSFGIKHFYFLTLFMLLFCSQAFATENQAADTQSSVDTQNTETKPETDLSNVDKIEDKVEDKAENKTKQDDLSTESKAIQEDSILSDDSKKPVEPASQTKDITAEKKPEPSTDDVQIIQKKSSTAGLRGITWDLELEAGVLAYANPQVRYRGMARIRAGVLLVSEPHYLSFGAAFEGWGQVEAATLETVYTHLYSGLWTNAGLGITTKKEFTLHIAAGFTLVGVEFQKNFGSGLRDNYTIITKLRIPIGILVFGLTH